MFYKLPACSKKSASRDARTTIKFFAKKQSINTIGVSKKYKIIATYFSMWEIIEQHNITLPIGNFSKKNFRLEG